MPSYDPTKTAYGRRVLSTHLQFLESARGRASQLGWPDHAPGIAVIECSAVGTGHALGLWATYSCEPESRDELELFSHAAARSGTPMIDFAPLFDEMPTVWAMYSVVAGAYASQIVSACWFADAGRAYGAVANLMGLSPEGDAGSSQVERVVAAGTKTHTAVIAAHHDSQMREDLKEHKKALVIGGFSQEVVAAMASAATGQRIATDSFWPSMWNQAWVDCFMEGMDTMWERLEVLAPDGLPPAE